MAKNQDDVYMNTSSWESLVNYYYVIIIDYGSVFVLFYEHDICMKTRLKPKGNKNESKAVQFPVAKMPFCFFKNNYCFI